MNESRATGIGYLIAVLLGIGVLYWFFLSAAFIATILVIHTFASGLLLGGSR